LDLKTLAADCSELFDNFKRHFGESFPAFEPLIPFPPAQIQTRIEPGHKRSYTKYGPKKSHIMLKLTKKADYGLMALKYLAEHPETAALSAKDIADAYGIPAQLLAKILQQLTRKGLLKSHAGMNGGYALAKQAASISAYEVILAIDGPFFITSCTKGANGCDLTPSCTIKEPLARVNETIAGVLKSISIQDLAEHENPAGQIPEPKLVTLTI
jgi:Rrf2 family protein